MATSGSLAVSLCCTVLKVRDLGENILTARQQWEDRWNQLRAASGYFIIVVEDVAEEKVVGAATLLLERKFIHQCGQVAS